MSADSASFTPGHRRILARQASRWSSSATTCLIGRARDNAHLDDLEVLRRFGLNDQHAADVCLVRRGPRIPVAQKAMAASRRLPRLMRASRSICYTRPSTPRISTPIRWRSTAALEDERTVYPFADAALDGKFLEESASAGLANLKGHRSVGGMRASIYNAVGEEAVDALIAFMADFEKVNG